MSFACKGFRKLAIPIALCGFFLGCFPPPPPSKEADFFPPPPKIRLFFPPPQNSWKNFSRCVRNHFSRFARKMAVFFAPPSLKIGWFFSSPSLKWGWFFQNMMVNSKISSESWWIRKFRILWRIRKLHREIRKFEIYIFERARNLGAQIANLMRFSNSPLNFTLETWN